MSTTYPHEWEGDDGGCAYCHCTRLDSGHHVRDDEECHARLRDELNAERKRVAELERALADERAKPCVTVAHTIDTVNM